MNTIEQNLVNTTVTLDISKGFFSDGEQKDVAGVIQISVAIVTVEVASHLHVFRVRVVHGAVRVRGVVRDILNATAVLTYVRWPVRCRRNI